MNTIKTVTLLGFLFVLAMSCNETQTPSSEIQETTTDTITTVEEKEVVTEEMPLTIFQNSFFGISPGSKIADHEAIIEKGLLQTGEGDFEIYNIKDEKHGVLGYFFINYNDNELVGSICITSPLAKTEENIGIGSSFGDLLTKYENLEVHGSEIESQTFASQGSLAFKIDELHSSHDLEINAIAKEAKILEVHID